MRTRVLSIVAILVTPAPALAQDAATGAPSEEAPAEEGQAASRAEEEKALEEDMKAAKKEIQVAPEQKATPGFEELEAAPVEGSVSADENALIGTKGESRLEAKLSGTEGLDSARPWGGVIVLDHFVGSGTFMSDATLRSHFAYVGQSWDIRPHYVFDFQSIKLKAAARILFEYEYTTPDTSPARRFKPADTTLSLSAPELYREPWSEVSLNASIRWLLPTSWESINVKEQWGAAGFAIGAQRFFGPLHVAYSFAMYKYFNSEIARTTVGSVCPLGASCYKAGRDAPPSGTGAEFSYPAGPLNYSFAVLNTFAVDYSISENMSVSYSLLIRNFFAYKDSNVNVADSYCSPVGDCTERGQTDELWPSLSVDYVIDEWVKKAVDLPVSLSVSAGITALHPAQTKDNKSIMWPFFYQAFAQGRAADNYGSVFLDLAGSF